MSGELWFIGCLLLYEMGGVSVHHWMYNRLLGYGSKVECMEQLAIIEPSVRSSLLQQFQGQDPQILEVECLTLEDAAELNDDLEGGMIDLIREVLACGVSHDAATSRYMEIQLPYALRDALRAAIGKEPWTAYEESVKRQEGKVMTVALDDVLAERRKQDLKWGEQNHDPFCFLAILVEEVGELAQAVLHARSEGVTERRMREEAVQVAAVALAIVECFDRQKWEWEAIQCLKPS